MWFEAAVGYYNTQGGEVAWHPIFYLANNAYPLGHSMRIKSAVSSAPTS